MKVYEYACNDIMKEKIEINAHYLKKTKTACWHDHERER